MRGHVCEGMRARKCRVRTCLRGHDCEAYADTHLHGAVSSPRVARTIYIPHATTFIVPGCGQVIVSKFVVQNHPAREQNITKKAQLLK